MRSLLGLRFLSRGQDGGNVKGSWFLEIVLNPVKKCPETPNTALASSPLRKERPERLRLRSTSLRGLQGRHPEAGAGSFHVAKLVLPAPGTHRMELSCRPQRRDNVGRGTSRDKHNYSDCVSSSVLIFQKGFTLEARH